MAESVCIEDPFAWRNLNERNPFAWRNPFALRIRLHSGILMSGIRLHAESVCIADPFAWRNFNERNLFATVLVT